LLLLGGVCRIAGCVPEQPGPKGQTVRERNL
jgi:hypothetical protein